MRKILYPLIFCCIQVYSQGELRPRKQVSLESGYRNVFSTIYRGAANTVFSNNASNGYFVNFDYAWNLRFCKEDKPNIYISVPIEYSRFAANTSNDKNITVWAYGWTVRHELRHAGNFTPFLSYSLLLNRLSADKTDGEAMGHNTRLEAGTNFKTRGRFIPYAKISYCYSTFPQLFEAKSYHVQAWSVAFGLRYNR